MNRWKVPLSDTSVGEDEISAVTKVLYSKWLSMGPITAEFEKKFADFIGVKHAFAVTNCTAALHLANLALGVASGDNVICPSLTFVATANSIRYTNAKPTFADITSKTNLNISPDDIISKIDKKTKGIIVVHYGGYPCDMDAIMSIAKQYNLYVIEDVAHAPGAAFIHSPLSTTNLDIQETRTSTICGAIGDIGCFSFFSNKNMTTAEGGMITTNHDHLAEKLRILRSHGMSSLTWDRERGHSFSYDVTDLGFNYRIDEIRAAIGLCQLEKVVERNQRRKEITNFYFETLGSLGEVTLPFQDFDQKSSHHIFPIILNKGCRNDFMTHLKSKGIQTSIHYPLIHKFSSYLDMYSNTKLPISEGIESSLVTLPLFADMSQNQVRLVSQTIKEWLAKQNKI